MLKFSTMKHLTVPPLPEHCSTREVAQALGLAVRSVQLMVDRGELQAWKTPGGHRRIARTSVQQWLTTLGSKAELFAALSQWRDPEACLICNGYKDEE